MNKLAQELAQFCQQHLLEEKFLIAPSRFAGNQMLRCIARSGHAWTNVRVETLWTLATTLAAASLAEDKLNIASHAQHLTLLEIACDEVWKDVAPFNDLSSNMGILGSLLRDIDELGFAGITHETLCIPTFSDSRKIELLAKAWKRYDDLLRQHQFVTRPDILRRATHALEETNHRFVESLFLVPESQELREYESAFLNRLSSTRLYMLARDTFDSVGDSDAGFTYFHALGEENEVREVMRALFDRDLPGDDVEILYSDGSYAPLIHSLSAQHEWPMTYADGIAVSFTRPGQALLHYLDWLSSDYDCEVLAQGLQSEALNCHARGFNGRYFASPECAVVLRKAKIGWGRERYLPALDQYQSKIDFRLTNQETASETSSASSDLDKAKVVCDWVKSLLDLSPDDSSPLTLADLAAGGLKLLDYASVAGEQDAAALTSLQQLLGEYTKLVGIDLPFLDAVDRLRSAILGLTAGRSGPQEGHVHVSSIKDGGWSGRGHTFVIGLDEKRFPRAGIQGSILLDSDREAINSNLGSQAMSLQSTRVPLEREQFRRLISSLRGNISLSYSSRDILKDQDQFPSPAMLEVFRKEKHREEADYEALRQNLGVARGFVTASGVSLDSTEGWLRSLQACHQLSGSELSQILDRYPGLKAGRLATDHRQSRSFTAYDGCIQMGGRVAFCASGQVESASALETLGACPYKYFLQYVLGVNKLQILERDPTLWLDPMDKGKLLHRVFQVFMSGITEQGMKPVFERDQDTIHQIAEDEMTRWRIKVPPPNPAAYGSQRREILAICDVFLRDEETNCQNCTPVYFELAFGNGNRVVSRPAFSNPAEIEIGENETLRLRGSIDRVDRMADGSYTIWDYKTGSFRLNENDPLYQGRQLQHAIYALALESLEPGSTVQEAGYFYPGPKAHGRRAVFKCNREATMQLVSYLVQLAADGVFVRTDRKDDCCYCDYLGLCGDAESGAKSTKSMLEATLLENACLDPMRKLRAYGQ